jgi:peroxiredoxin Q/BCP
MSTPLKQGDKAPTFRVRTADGSTLSRKDMAKKPYVMYFYPRDNTPGCTREAQSFRDAMPEFRKRGVTVLGVSTNSVSSHARFAANHELPFSLLADTDGKVASAYGVLKPAGKSAERVTFLIDAKGVIRKVWPKVTVIGHAKDVLDAIEELGL